MEELHLVAKRSPQTPERSQRWRARPGPRRRGIELDQAVERIQWSGPKRTPMPRFLGSRFSGAELSARQCKVGAPACTARSSMRPVPHAAVPSCATTRSRPAANRGLMTMGTVVSGHGGGARLVREARRAGGGLNARRSEACLLQVRVWPSLGKPSRMTGERAEKTHRHQLDHARCGSNASSCCGTRTCRRRFPASAGGQGEPTLRW